MRKRRRNRETRIIGVDASLTSTGLAYPDLTTETVPKTNEKGWERNLWILKWVGASVDFYKPSHICLEGYAFSRGQVGRVFDIAELGGCLKLLFLSKGLPIILVPPTTLKIYAAGKGNAKKEYVMKEIKRRWGRSFVSSDRADAFALQQFGIDYVDQATESPGELRALGKAELIEPIPDLQTFAKFG